MNDWKSKYKKAISIRENLYKVSLDDVLWGIVDKQGAEIVPPKYESIEEFLFKRSEVRIKSLKGFIDPKGEEVIPLIYLDVKKFRGPITAVQKGDKWGFIDQKGKVVVPFKYEWTGAFFKKYCSVKFNNLIGLINFEGQEVVPCKFMTACNPRGNYSEVQQSGGRVGIYDIRGKQILTCKYKIQYFNFSSILTDGEPVIVKPVEDGDTLESDGETLDVKKAGMVKT